MKIKRSTECAVLMELGACHGCPRGCNLAFHVDFRLQIHRVRIFCGGQPILGRTQAQDPVEPAQEKVAKGFGEGHVFIAEQEGKAVRRAGSQPAVT